MKHNPHFSKYVFALAYLGLTIQPGFGADVAPTAGGLLQQVPQNRPNLPSNNAPVLPKGTASKAGDEDKKTFLVARFVIEGHTSFTTEELHALVVDQEGKMLGVNGLNAAAQRITDHYKSHGFFLSRAVVPAQKITNDTVRIQVVEAQLGQIKLNNTSEVKDSVISSLLNGALQSNEQINQAAFERGLLLVRDLPNIAIEPTLTPGAETGQSDVNLSAINLNDAVAAQVGADNGGNAYTGRYRVNASLSWFNPLSLGDILSLNAMSSGADMKYVGASYETALGAYGSRIGASSSAMNYALGGSLRSLGAHGTAHVNSLWLKHPMKRSVNDSVYVQLQGDHTALNDVVDTAGTTNKRHLNAMGLMTNGEHTRGGDLTTWRIGLHAGQVTFDNAVAQASDLNAANTHGTYRKANFGLTHTNSLSRQTELYARVSGARANKNLDASQKLIVGGPNSVRAYDVGVLAGDKGVDTSLEWRSILTDLGSGSLQGKVFYDYAQLTINANPWAGLSTANSAHIAGAGLGLVWTSSQNAYVKLSVAKPVGSAPSSVTTSTRLRTWVELGLPF
jgi:hemolysin activation/secretion protein